MDELVKVVAAQTGLPEAKAQEAATAVLSFLKDKLPAPLAAQVDAALDNPAAADQSAGMLKKGMSLFGKK